MQGKNDIFLIFADKFDEGDCDEPAKMCHVNVAASFLNDFPLLMCCTL